MTIANRFDNWPLWSRPNMLWLAHATPALWLVNGLNAVIAQQLRWPLFLVTAIALLLLQAVAVGAWQAHDTQLCRRCATNTPLNYAQATTLVRASLWVHHHSDLVLIACALGMITSFAVPMPVMVAGAAWLACALVMGMAMKATLIHRVYRPGCPYCRRGWDDDPDAPTEPTPSPAPSKTNSVL